MTYDMASHITQLSFTSLVGANGTSAYSYDFTNQLTAADHTGTGMPADESFAFDTNGNRTMEAACHAQSAAGDRRASRSRREKVY